MGEINTRLKKARKITDEDGKEKLVLSKGMISRVKELMSTPPQPDQRLINRDIRRKMERVGFIKVKIVNGFPASAVKDGELWDSEKIKSWTTDIVNKTQTMDMIQNFKAIKS